MYRWALGARERLRMIIIPPCIDPHVDAASWLTAEIALPHQSILRRVHDE